MLCGACKGGVDEGEGEAVAPTDEDRMDEDVGVAVEVGAFGVSNTWRCAVCRVGGAVHEAVSGRGVQ